MPRSKQTIEQSLIKIRGDEPIVTKERYNEQILRALNWYNANKEEEDFRSYLEMYVKRDEDLAKHAHAVAKASFLEIKPLAVIARLILQGQYVAINHMLSLLVGLDQLSNKYQKTARAADPLKAPVMSVQEKVAELAGKHVSEINAVVDEFVATRKSDFSMRSYILKNNISGPVAKKIAEKFTGLGRELLEAVKGANADLKEGYSNFKKTELKRFADFVNQLVLDCTQQVVTAKTNRKQRVKKAKPPSVVAAKVKPMKEFAELGLKSIDPSKIVGANELWVYTPTTRKLTVYRSAQGATLSVSGSSVRNYDPDKSETKTLRKPSEFFAQLGTTGKRALASAWKAVRAKVSSPRSRITDQQILFAAN